jgi:hypothetical protein
MTALVTSPLAVSTVMTQTPLLVIWARRASYGYSGIGVLTATAFAADSDIVPTMRNSASPGWAAGVARFFARVFFSVGGAGVASSSIRGVSSAMGGGFSLAASVGISTVGSDVRFLGRGVGVACTVIAGSKSPGEAASWARATCDAPNAIVLTQDREENSSVEVHQEIVRRSPQSGINSSVDFRSRYFICSVPALLLLSGPLFNHLGQLKSLRA